ncbi:MAG: DUF1016 N-terminal domain-containing protein [Methylococcaceae bacterium]|nr:DUF1016 N-terminal domain-containing protein [Methylococcaceae bacterium]
MNGKGLADNALLTEIKNLIQTAKKQATVAVNAELTLLYWQVGKRIADDVLNGERADYGKQIIAHLAQQLTRDYGRGWSKRNLAQMIKFSEVFPDVEIVQTLSAQLSWSHFVCLIAVTDALKREFYLTMALQERWSTRTLTERIENLILKDPYIFDFLGLISVTRLAFFGSTVRNEAKAGSDIDIVAMNLRRDIIYW